MLYYLQNHSVPYLGNSVMWWAKGGSGYTDRIDNAELFSEDEADKIIQSTQSTHRFVKWEQEVVERSTVRVVDMQDLSKNAVSLKIVETAIAGAKFKEAVDTLNEFRVGQ